MSITIKTLDQKTWGVCGFVASIQAAYFNINTQIFNSSGSYETLFPVIEKFCKDHTDLEKDLLNFSAVFGVSYNYASLQQVLTAMQQDKSMNAENIGIAMTANAVSSLCKDLGFKSANFIGTTTTTNQLDNVLKYKNTIFGLGKKTNTTRIGYRSGLLHWVYIDKDGNLLTWGDEISQKDIIEYLKNADFDKVTHYLTLS